LARSRRIWSDRNIAWIKRMQRSKGEALRKRTRLHFTMTRALERCLRKPARAVSIGAARETRPISWMACMEDGAFDLAFGVTQQLFEPARFAWFAETQQQPHQTRQPIDHRGHEGLDFYFADDGAGLLFHGAHYAPVVKRSDYSREDSCKRLALRRF
jgi:hypothetical protein